MGISEFFTNEEKTKDEKVDIGSPAFSATKVQATIGGLIAVIAGTVPTTLKEDESVVIAAIAAGTLLMLGIFALIGVDIRTRQRAQEAKLRYGGGKPSEPSSFQALPVKDLVLQLGHNNDEYEVRYASVEKDLVHVFADREGAAISATFKESPKPK